MGTPFSPSPQRAHRQSSRLDADGSSFDMRILQNLSVHSHERSIENASRRDDDLIRGITVELAGKLGGLHADAR